MNLGELPAVCGKTCLYFQLERHVYLITVGSIVTRSITLQKYSRYVIITRRKPLLFSTLRSPMLCFSAHFLDNLEYKTLPYRYGHNRISAKQNKKKHRLFCNLINFLAMKNRTRQTGEWSVICTRPTLLTLAWPSGRALMSNPEKTVHSWFNWNLETRVCADHYDLFESRIVHSSGSE